MALRRLIVVLSVVAAHAIPAQTVPTTTHLGGKASAIVNLQVMMQVETDWTPFERIMPNGSNAGSFTVPPGTLLVVTDLDVWTWGSNCYGNAKGWVGVPNGQVPQITFDSHGFAEHKTFFSGVLFSAPPVVYVGYDPTGDGGGCWWDPNPGWAFVILRGYLVADE